MRVDVPENTSHREHDPRTTDRDSRSYDDRIYSGNRFNRGGFSYFDRLRRPGAFRMREHYGDDTSTGHSRFHDFVLEKFGLIVGVGVVALIAWLAAKILKLAVLLDKVWVLFWVHSSLGLLEV